MRKFFVLFVMAAFSSVESTKSTEDAVIVQQNQKSLLKEGRLLNRSLLVKVNSSDPGDKILSHHLIPVAHAPLRTFIPSLFQMQLLSKRPRLKSSMTRLSQHLQDMEKSTEQSRKNILKNDTPRASKKF